MTANLLDLRSPHKAASADLPALQSYLTQLIGEPFHFARVSYGDELTLHFGDLRPSHSPKLKNKLYGAYILGMRGSPWVIKSGAEPLVLTAGFDPEHLLDGVGKRLRNEELEATPFIQPESRVLSVTPFVVEPSDAFGLQLRTVDGSSVLVLPTAAEDPEQTEFPAIALADWELATPLGLLSAGTWTELVVQALCGSWFVTNSQSQ